MTRYGLRLFWVVCMAASVASDRAGAAFEEAAKLLAEKKYEAVETALKDELVKPAPAPEALRLSLQAARADGRYVTAQKRVARLLHRTEEWDPDLVYEAADLSALTGDERLALTRFALYVSRVQEKSDKLERALRYLLERGSYPDEYRRYVKLFGAGDPAWRLGTRQLDRLFELLEADAGLALADFMTETFLAPEQSSHLMWRLRAAADRYELGKDVEARYKRPLLMIVKRKTPLGYDHGLFEHFLNQTASLLTPAEGTGVLFNAHERIDRPWGWGLIHRFSWMRALETQEERLGAGKRYLELEPRYRDAEDPNRYKEYLRVLAESPQVFVIPSNTLVTAEAAVAKFERCMANFKAAGLEVNPNHEMHYFQSYLLGPDNAARAAFMRKYLPILDSSRLRSLVSYSPEAEFDVILAEYRKTHSYREVLDAEWGLLDWYGKLNRTGDVSRVSRDYVFAYPFTFSASHLMQWFVRRNDIPADARVAPLLELAEKGGGENARLTELTGWMKNEMWNGTNRWDELEGYRRLTSLVEANAEGSDRCLTSYRVLLATPQTRSEPNPPMQEEARAFLASYEGAIPGGRDEATSPEGLVAYAVFELHGLHSWDNAETITSWAEMWAPRLGVGPGWGWMVSRLADHGASHALFSRALPPFVAVARAAKTVDPATWRAWTRMVMPQGETNSPLAEFFDRMGADNVFDHVATQRGPWDGHRQFLMDQTVAAMARPDYTSTQARERGVIEHFYHRTTDAIGFPTNFVQNLWAAYLAHEDEQGKWDERIEALAYGHYVRAKKVEPAAAHLRAYLELIKKRPVLAQIRSLNRLLEVELPVEPDATLLPGHRYGLMFNVLMPLYGQIPPGEAESVMVCGNLCYYLTLAHKAWEGESKKKAGRFAALLAGKLRDGAAFTGHFPYSLDMVQRVALDALERGEWSVALEWLTYIAEYSRRDNSFKYALDVRVRPLAGVLADKGAHELSFTFLDAMLRQKGVSADVSEKLLVLKSRAAQRIPGLIPVDPRNPTYDLHVAAQAQSLGNEVRAWQLTLPKLKLLRQKWQEIDPLYVAWSLEQMRKQKMLKEALEFAFTILLQEQDLDPEIAARILLCKGDIQRDSENFQAARIEYESLKANRRYELTMAGGLARFHLIELMIMIKDYGSAERYLARLEDAVDIEHRAEANFLYAWIAFDQEDFQLAKEYLTKAFKLRSDHVEARLMEGELKLRLPRGLIDTEVAVGNPTLRTIAIPGRPLTLKLQDPNLSVARAGAAIPVIVSTSKGKDQENVSLHPSAADKTLFVGTIQTGLGEVKPRNLVLELAGDDVVSYVIDPAFQAANDIDYPPKELEVRSSAELVANSGEILSREEREKREIEERLNPRHWELESARFRGRTGRTIRPGSPIYVQVTDFDRDVSGEKDSLTVDLETSSGDVLSGFALLETEPHSGVFKGEVTTGIPFPRATVSDSQEGLDPGCMINSTRTNTWSSLADGRAPKWIEIDTMTSHEVASVGLALAPGIQVKRLRLEGMLEDAYEPLGYFPSREAQQQGGATVLVARNQAGATPEQIRRFLRVAGDVTYHQDHPGFDRTNTVLSARDGWLTSQVRGVFYVPENTALELQFLQEGSPHGWQYAYLFIDGEQILGGSLRDEGILRQTRRVSLVKGVHRLETLCRDHWRGSRVIVGYRQDDGNMAPLPADWFSPTAHAELAEFLKVRAEIAQTNDGFTATLAQPVRLRKLRWVVEEFVGNVVSVREVRVIDAQGKTLIPGEQDFAGGTRNDTLEISPGDRVAVIYEDELRLKAEESELREELHSTFYNGEIALADEEIYTIRDERRVLYRPARRCRVGDQLMIVVTEYDQDISDERDTMEVQVRTSSGESLTTKALETTVYYRYHSDHDRFDRHSGIFMATLGFGEETSGNTIKVQPGDEITVSYLDKENTRPGIPVERRYSLFEAGLSQPEFTVYRTAVELVEDKSAAAEAKVKRMRRQGAADDDIVIYRDQIIATHPDYRGARGGSPVAAAASPSSAVPVSVGAPLLFEIDYPRAALHEGSVLKARVVSEAELVAAKAEGREPDVLEAPLYVKPIAKLAADKGYGIRLQSYERKDESVMLSEGTFAGLVRLQVGRHGDELDDLVVAREKEFASRYERTDLTEAQRDYLYRVPSLLVSGSDVVRVEVADEQTGETMVLRLKLLSDAKLELLDRSFTYQRPAVHFGERFYVKVTDPDRDKGDEQDVVQVQVRADSGDSVTLDVTETMGHSGVFTASVLPEFMPAVTSSTTVVSGGDTGGTAVAVAPAVGEAGTNAPAAAPAGARFSTEDDVLHTVFGDQVTFEYVDVTPLSSNSPTRVAVTGRVYLGADAELAVFTKKFKDPEVAVRTRFLLAEAMFEMAKEHRKLEKTELAEEEIGKGKRVLEEAMRDYPDTALAAQGEFLLANLAQELEKYQEAIGRYANVISHWPDSEYASRSQFKKAICMEKLKNYKQACEEYVKLTYLYPDSGLVADATVRLGNYFYRNEKFKTAGRIFFKFQQHNGDHALAPRSLFLAGQCYMRMQDYKESIRLLSLMLKTYTEEHDVRPEAMYWLADSYSKLPDYVKAYQTFKTLTWDYPETKWAKISRGRLTDEVFSRIEDMD